MAHSHKEYNFKYEKNYNFMFVATISIAISLSMTAFYLIFYSISDTINQLLNGFDYMGKLVMMFGFTFAFIGSELIVSSLYFPFLFAITAILIINLVLVQHENGRIVSFWLSVGILVAVYVFDFTYHSSPK